MKILDYRAINDLAVDLVESYDIRCRDIQQRVGTLSGGNQQKLILARELFRSPRFTIAVQPTRGLDIGSTEYVRSMLITQAQRGGAILLISTELDEILALSHRISVMYEGYNMGTFPREVAKREELGLLMAGKQV
jgi:simple sugar transport system ATP-binding protein